MVSLTRATNTRSAEEQGQYRMDHMARLMSNRSLLKPKFEASWSFLPTRFRLTGSLMSSSDSPIERDFAASARLNHLHVLFLLQLSCEERNNELEPELWATSSEILNLVNEENMLKEHLVSSGTGLLWRVIDRDSYRDYADFP